MKTYLVDICISIPQGENLDDWILVGKNAIEIEEGRIARGTMELANEVFSQIQEYRIANAKGGKDGVVAVHPRN